MNSKEKTFLKELIGQGYFPRELPPLFSTMNLSSITGKFIEIEQSLNTEPKFSKAISFSIPKGREQRRNLCIPNPHHQFLLSKVIVENWEELNNFYKLSKLSLTKPIRKGKSSRAIEREYTFNEITRQSIIKSTASRYILKTDISRYYSTIYTHSIAWAIHGKDEAKKNRSNKLLGNVIDIYIRNTKDQQTLGIPIGPDTSLVVSEILGTSIDKMIADRIENVKGFRYVDDIYLYFRELGEAERAKYTLSSIFSEFELEMNTEKTKILKLHNEIESEWISELRLHSFDRKSEKDIISYFSKVFKFADLYPNDQVVKYAIKRVSKIDVCKECWEIFESFLLESVLRDSIVLSSVLDIFLKNKDKVEVNLKPIEETVNYIIEFNLNYGNSFELVWSMWYLYKFNIPMYSDNVIKVSTVDDPLVALMALFLNEIKLLDGELDTSIWKKHMISEELYSNYWILAYEAYVRKWLPSKSGKNYISNRPFFNMLKENNIRFLLDPEEIGLLKDDSTKDIDSGSGVNANMFGFEY